VFCKLQLGLVSGLMLVLRLELGKGLRLRFLVKFDVRNGSVTF